MEPQTKKTRSSEEPSDAELEKLMELSLKVDFSTLTRVMRSVKAGSVRNAEEVSGLRTELRKLREENDCTNRTLRGLAEELEKASVWLHPNPGVEDHRTL